MNFKRYAPWLLAIAALSASGCPSPTSPGNPLSTGDANTGGVRGFVFRDPARQQPPIPKFQVKAGDQTTTSADLTGLPRVEAAHEFDDVYSGQTVAVPHDFGDGKGAVDAERLPRKTPIGAAPADRYVYLHSGEFFFEQLPPGSVSVSATACGETATSSVNVAAGKVTPDADLVVAMPLPAQNNSGTVASVYAARVLSPEAGVTAQVQNGKVTYSASDAKIELKAWPGAAESKVDLVNLLYTYKGPQGEDEHLDARQISLAPVVTLAASDGQCYGAPASFSVPIVSNSVSNLFLSSSAPAQVTAVLTFVSESGDTLAAYGLSELSVSIPIKRQ